MLIVSDMTGIKQMKSIFLRQRGGSTIGLLIILAVIGVGVFIGMQYIPQYMEKGQVDSILDSIEDANASTTLTPKSVQVMIGKHLQINGMQDLADAFVVKKKDGKILVKVNFERQLDLIYEKRAMPYSRELVLIPK